MTFKKRLLEEGIGDAWDKTKEFTKNNAGLAAGLGGLGAGALYNYATSGAEDLAGERAQDAADWKTNEARDQLTSGRTLDKDTFTDLRDNIINRQETGLGVPSPFPYLTGQKEDMSWETNNQLDANRARMIAENPKIRLDYEPNAGKDILDFENRGKINDFQINHYGNSDQEYKDYVNMVKNQNINMTDADIQSGIDSNAKLASTQADMQADIKDSTPDSYRNAMLGGAALGAGGTYAARKLKERNQ